MSSPEPRKGVRYTWDDYRTWGDERRWELIGGEPFDMSAAPLLRHQSIVVKLSAAMEIYFRGRRCTVFPAPTDVRLSQEDVVQPDVVVVCNPEQLKRTHIEGAPALVVEILSPSTLVHDRVRKMNLYAGSGVREVWLITPYPWLAEVYVLDGNSFRLSKAYGREDTLQRVAFPELQIVLAEIFDYPIAPDEQVDLVKEGRPPYAPRAAAAAGSAGRNDPVQTGRD